MNKKHIHAEAMKQYAEDAMETDKPWERWEWLSVDNGWYDCHDNPRWVDGGQYRRKHKHQEFLDDVKAGRVDAWEVRYTDWDEGDWSHEHNEARTRYIQDYPEEWETRHKQEPKEVLPTVGTPVWVRDSKTENWVIAMFLGKGKYEDCAYKVACRTGGDSHRYFKYMTTENPYKPTV